MRNKRFIFIPLLVLICVGVIGLVWSIIDFKVTNKVLSYSSEIIQFNYDGASDGKDPNGNPFNPTDFLTDEVISNGLTLSDLAGTYDASKVREFMTVENVVPKNIVAEIDSYDSIIKDSSDMRSITSSDYHPIRYRFVLYHDLDKKLSESTLNELLTNIVKSYGESFYSTFKRSFELANYDEIYSVDNDDYIYQVEVYTNKINLLSSSSNDLYNKHADFSVNNQSFKDIALKCDQILSSDITRINSIIVLNALSKDIDRLKDYYNYKIEMLNYDKVKYTSDLTAVTAQINAYEKDSTFYVGAGDSMIKVDSNSSATYDALLAKQIETSERIAKINIELTNCQSILADIEAATGDDSAKNLVESYITKLENDYSTLEASFKEMIDKYNEKYITTGTVSATQASYQSSSLVSTSFIVRFIKICAPLELVALLGVCIYWMLREIKKNKKYI